MRRLLRDMTPTQLAIVGIFLMYAGALMVWEAVR